MEDNSAWWIRALSYAMFAAMGGLLGHLMRIIDGQSKVNWIRAAFEGVAAGFVGLLILFVCDALNLGQQWTGVIVGVSGWLGASATIRMLEGIVRKKLGLNQTGDP